MQYSPIGYPKGKKGFSWLVWVRIKGKKMVVVLFKVIMRTLMILLDLASRVRVFIWSLMSRGRLSIISVISIRVEEEDGSKDEDRSVVEYTHKGEGITVVLTTRGFLER